MLYNYVSCLFHDYRYIISFFISLCPLLIFYFFLAAVKNKTKLSSVAKKCVALDLNVNRKITQDNHVLFVLNDTNMT